jgi:hypothetical protein
MNNYKNPTLLLSDLYISLLLSLLLSTLTRFFSANTNRMFLYETDVYFTYKTKKEGNRFVVGKVMVNTTFSISNASIHGKHIGFFILFGYIR